ncbi:ornithine cyclodeaminase family protein [Clostridium sp. DL1XJH146]
MLILKKEDIQKVFSMKDAITSAETALKYLSQGKSDVPIRTNLGIPKFNGQSLFMPGYVGDLDALGIKIVSVFPENIKRGIPSLPANMILLDGTTGQISCIMDGATLTHIRTGAAAGAATNLLAKKNAKIGALIGTGGQAASQLEAMITVRDLEEVRIFSRNYEKAEKFTKEMSEKFKNFPTKFITVKSSQEAVTNADIITAATTSKVPVFDGTWVKKGAHINAMGSFIPEMQELDEYIVKKAGCIYADSIDAVLCEAGDLLIPMGKGLLDKEHINGEIGTLILNKTTGRTDDDEITIFESVGTAVLDVVAASSIYEKAIENKIGFEINL